MADLGSLWATLGVDTTQLDMAIVKMNEFQVAANTSLASVQSGLNSASRAMQSFGRSATMYMSVPLALAGVAVFELSSKFEASMQKITALTGESQEQVNKWTQNLLELGPALGKSPDELAKALYFIASSGIHGADALNVLTLSAKASAAGLGETEVVAKIVTSALNAYVGTGLTASKVVDQLTASVKESKAPPEEMAKALGTVLPVASALGVSFGQVSGALAAATMSGLSTQQAATGLRQVMVALEKPTADAQLALQVMGTSAKALQDSLTNQGLLPTLQTLEQLTEKWGIDALEKVIPNIRAFNVMLTMVGSNADRSNGIMNQTINSTGAGEKAYQSITETLQQRFNVALSTSEAALIKVGLAMKGSIIPLLDSFAKAIQSLSAWFTSLSPSMQSFIFHVGGILIAMGPVVLIISVLIKTFGALVGIIRLVSIAVVDLTTVMAANPILALITVIAILGVTIYELMKTTDDATESQKRFNEELIKTSPSLRLMDTTQEIQKAMAILPGLNKTQTNSLKETIEEQLAAEDKYIMELKAKIGPAQNATQVLFGSSNMDVSFLAEQQLAAKRDAARKLDLTQTLAYHTQQITMLKEYDAQVKAELAKQKGGPDFNQTEAIAKVMNEWRANLKAVDIEAAHLPNTFDAIGKKATETESAIGKMARIPNISMDNPAFKELTDSLDNFDLKSKKTTEILNALNGEIAEHAAMAKLIGPTYQQDAKDLTSYDTALGSFVKQGIMTGTTIEMLSQRMTELHNKIMLEDAAKNYDEALKKMALDNSLLAASAKDIGSVTLALQQVSEKARAATEYVNALWDKGFRPGNAVMDMAIKNAQLFNQQVKNLDAQKQALNTLADSFTKVGQAIKGNTGSWLTWTGQLLKDIPTIITAVQQLGISQEAQGIAGAVSASSSLPFPANLAAMAAGVAEVIALIASAPTMAEGGIIPSGYPGDTYPALLTSGEMVIPPGKLDNIPRGVGSDKANGNGSNAEVVFRMSGYELTGVIDKYNNKRSKV